MYAIIPGVLIGIFLLPLIWAVFRWKWWRYWAFRCCLVGLVLLPTLVGVLFLLSPPGQGPGWGGGSAAAAAGMALVFSLYVSPIVGVMGFLVGWAIDYRKRSGKPKE